jgi:aryl-alcohol dehydrogenase-like predicted oxidoreductase
MTERQTPAIVLTVRDYGEADLRKCVEASLSRLGVDCLDLIQLHCIPMKILEGGEVFEHLRISYLPWPSVTGDKKILALVA